MGKGSGRNMAKVITTLALLAAATQHAGAFTVPGAHSVFLRSSSARAAAVPALRMQKGFGAKPPPKKVSEIAKDRKRAAGKYEELKDGGSPEFNVFFRKVGATDEDGAIKGGWYPVGSLACPSSQEIGKAIYTTEDAFLQGAFRIHGKQVKKEFVKRDGGAVGNWKDMKDCDIEYGWQFKGFEDEDVRVAERPEEPSAVAGFFSKISEAVNWVPDQK